MCSAAYLSNPLLHDLLLIYRLRKDERLSRLSWLNIADIFLLRSPDHLQAERRQGKFASHERHSTHSTVAVAVYA